MEILVLLVILYPLPLVIACARGCNSRLAIILVSLLLGWFPFVTLICIFWAICGSTSRRQRRQAKMLAREFVKAQEQSGRAASRGEALVEEASGFGVWLCTVMIMLVGGGALVLVVGKLLVG